MSAGECATRTQDPQESVTAPPESIFPGQVVSTPHPTKTNEIWAVLWLIPFCYQSWRIDSFLACRGSIPDHGNRIYRLYGLHRFGFPVPSKTLKLYIPFIRFPVPSVLPWSWSWSCPKAWTTRTTTQNPLYFRFNRFLVSVGVFGCLLGFVWDLISFCLILGVLSWIVGVWVWRFYLESLYLVKSKDKEKIRARTRTRR